MDDVLNFAQQYKMKLDELESLNKAFNQIQGTKNVGIQYNMSEIVLIGSQKVVGKLSPKNLDLKNAFLWAISDRISVLERELKESAPVAEVLQAIVDL